MVGLEGSEKQESMLVSGTAQVQNVQSLENQQLREEYSHRESGKRPPGNGLYLTKTLGVGMGAGVSLSSKPVGTSWWQSWDQSPDHLHPHIRLFLPPCVTF